jgi:hypothetical protein
MAVVVRDTWYMLLHVNLLSVPNQALAGPQMVPLGLIAAVPLMPGLRYKAVLSCCADLF